VVKNYRKPEENGDETMSKLIVLTKADKEACKSLDEKVADIRDHTILCAQGHLTGCYIHGEGGIGKSYTVIKTLNDQSVQYRLHNTRMSGRGFFNRIQSYLNDVHVCEDIENIFTERIAMNLLRSACWGQTNDDGRMIRPVTWTIAGEAELTVDFTGSIIFTGNRPLGKIPELRALATRIDIIELVVTYEEILARMKQISLKGFKTDKGELTPAKCCEVLELFLTEWPIRLVPDMRLLVLAFRKRIGVELLAKEIKQTWQHLMTNSIKQAVRARSDEDKNDQAIQLAKELSAKVAAKKITSDQAEQEFAERTGMSRRTYYRYKD
jgi:hypothetical protein